MRALDSWDDSPMANVVLRVARDERHAGCPAHEPPIVAKVLSSDSGWVTVDGLRPGRYVVETRRSGLDPLRWVVWVRGGRRDTLTFVMGPATTR